MSRSQFGRRQQPKSTASQAKQQQAQPSLPRNEAPVPLPSRESRSRPERRSPARTSSTGRSAQLIVSGPSHGQVQLAGFGTWFPANHLHARRATGVVVGNDCELVATDHYHVHRASLDMEQLLDLPLRAKIALRTLLANPGDGELVKAFQQTLQVFVQPTEELPNQVQRPLATTRTVVIDDSACVQLGDESSMYVTSRYVVEETIIPIVELLARDADAIKEFVRALQEPVPAEATTAFLRHCLGAAGRLDELAYLARVSGLDGVDDVSLFSFFGFAQVTDAAAVMAGSGNTMKVDLRVDLPTISGTDVSTGLGRLRTEFGLVSPSGLPQVGSQASDEPRTVGYNPEVPTGFVIGSNRTGYTTPPDYPADPVDDWPSRRQPPPPDTELGGPP